MIASSATTYFRTGPTSRISSATYALNDGPIIIIATKQLLYCTVCDDNRPIIEIEFPPLFSKKKADIVLNMRCAIERINALCKVMRPKVVGPLLPLISRLMLFCKSGFVGRVAKRLKGR